MRTRTVRDTRVALPVDDPADLALLARIPLSGERLTDHTITGDTWSRATITDTVISQCWLTGADLASATFTDVTLDRCVFNGCTMMGSNWDTVTLRDVLFEDCRLDYSTLTAITAAGAIAFQRCSFTEVSITASRLGKAAFDQCRLGQLELDQCDLRGTDLRGNELSDLAAATCLRGVQLDQNQLPALAEVLVRELAIAVTAR